MPNKLNHRDKLALFDYLSEYSWSYQHKYGLYNWNDTRLQSYFQANHIKGKGNQKSTDILLFWFETYKKNGVNDIAHHFLRHIRNAIAHGNVTKIKNGIIELKDYNSSGKQNMFGRIYPNMLFDIINIITQ